MPDEKITARPTSKTTADVEPIVLRAGEKSRLVFRPVLVDNTNHPAASVRGFLCYQKKRLSDAWADVESIKLTSLRDGEGVRLEMKSEELLKLFEAIGSLYDIMRRDGLPTSRTDYIPAPRSGLLRQLLQDGELEEVLGHEAQGGPVIRRFLSWISKRQSSGLMSALSQLDSAQLLNFDAAIAAARLKAFLKEWDHDKDRAEEGHWQGVLSGNSWVFSQLFASPIVLIKDQAYVGGKGIDNRGGNIEGYRKLNSKK
jgi:hypothetical protein